MHSNHLRFSTTLAGVVALFALWGVALAAMATLPEGQGGASQRVEEPTGVLISQQDMSGRTVFLRELRGSISAASPAGGVRAGDC